MYTTIIEEGEAACCKGDRPDFTTVRTGCVFTKHRLASFCSVSAPISCISRVPVPIFPAGPTAVCWIVYFPTTSCDTLTTSAPWTSSKRAPACSLALKIRHELKWSLRSPGKWWVNKHLREKERDGCTNSNENTSLQRTLAHGHTLCL